jgi:hypothetical protein
LDFFEGCPLDQKPEELQTFWERYQRFSERYYAPYAAWWFSPKGNLIAGVIAVLGLLLFYLFSKP